MTARSITSPLGTGARNILSGTISNGATWAEDVTLTDNDTVITNSDTWDWRMTFRSCSDDDATDLTLSTDDGTLTITQGSDSTTLSILVAYTALSGVSGDYIADLASKDSDNKVIHWAHGKMTFLHEPIWSS